MIYNNKCMKCGKIVSSSTYTTLCDGCWIDWSEHYNKYIHQITANKLFDAWLINKPKIFIFR